MSFAGCLYAKITPIHKPSFFKDLLQQYCAAVKRSQSVDKELKKQVQHLNSPDMQQKKKELDEQEIQLKNIEKKLGEWHNFISYCYVHTVKSFR